MNPFGLVVAAIGALLVFVGAKGAGIVAQRKGGTPGGVGSGPKSGAGELFTMTYAQAKKAGYKGTEAQWVAKGGKA